MKKLLPFLFLLISFTSRSQIITTVAGTTAGYSGDGAAATIAQIHHPIGLAIDAAGNYYIGDHDNNRVRRVSNTGIMTTFAGNGVGGYLADNVAATSTRLNQPYAVTLDNVGNLYIADAINHRVRKVDAAGVITTIAGTGTVGFSGDGAAATAARLNVPTCVRLDNSGNLYITDNGNHRIRKIDATGVISTVVGTGAMGYSGDGGAATAATVRFPGFISVDRSGNLLIADGGVNAVIRKVNTAGIISTIAGTGVNGYTGDGGPATNARLNFPADVITDAADNIYIADNLNSVIRKINTSGIISTIVGTGVAGLMGDGGPAISARLNTINQIAFDNSGDLYITDVGNERIRKVSNIGIMPQHRPHFTKGSSVSVGLCSSAGSVFTIDTLLSVLDTDAVVMLNWRVVTPPAHGTASASYVIAAIGGVVTPVSLTYTPTAGYFGADMMDIVVTDGISSDTITLNFNIMPLPYAGIITGAGTMCVPAPHTLTDVAVGGVWSSDATFIASVDGVGNVTPLSAGTATISYTFTNSCGVAAATKIITVEIAPSAGIVTGPAVLCMPAATILSSSVPGGVWSTVATSIATVNSTGMVTGVTPGIVTIDYTLTNSCGTDFTSHTIAVVLGVPSAGTITGAGAVCASASIAMSGSVPGGIWSSGAPSVAIVSPGGFVTGIAAGSATISYAVSNGCATAITVKMVTVDPLPVARSVVGVSKLCAGSSTSFGDWVSDGTWTTSSTAIAVVNNKGMVVGISEGKAIITYTVGNNCGTSFSTLPVTILSAARCLAMYEENIIADDRRLVVYPNPATGLFALSLSGGITEQATAVITNVTGQQVKRLFMTTNIENKMDLSELSSGMYFIAVTTAHGNYNTKLVIRE